MTSLCFPSSLILPSSPLHSTRLQLHRYPYVSTHRLTSLSVSLSVSTSLSLFHTRSSKEETISVINFEDFVEKDWSFLDSDNVNSIEEHSQKSKRIISAGEITEDSRVLVSIATEDFVDRLVDSKPCQFLFIVHESLLVLAGIKEKYDQVKCWQGELIHVPQKWAPFDVVFLSYFPALPFELDQIFGTLARRCSPGARVVISYPQGREVIKQQRQQYPDVVVSDLPDKMTLNKIGDDLGFEITEFVDEPGFYLAVLKFGC